LYELKDDIDCVNNLAESEAMQKTKQQLRERMEEKLHQQEDPRMEGKGSVFDNYIISTDSKDFHKRFTRGEPTRAGWVNPGDFEKENPE
jgi:predicted nuclease of predicted toxin-antitoxin system